MENKSNKKINEIKVVAGLPRLLPAGLLGLPTCPQPGQPSQPDGLLPDYCAHDCINNNTQITFLSLASHVRYIKLLTK